MKHADAHNKKDNYINMNIQKQFIKYVSQNICGMLGISCYIIVDTFFISQAAGTDGITVLNLVLPVYNLIFAIGSMIGVGSATRYAILKAQEDDSAKKYFANAILCILIISIPCPVWHFFSGYGDAYDGGRCRDHAAGPHIYEDFLIIYTVFYDELCVFCVCPQRQCSDTCHDWNDDGKFFQCCP